jgi:hypothetical protein
MTARFSFDVDPSRDLLRTRLSGFFTPDDMAAYVAARRDAFAQLRCPINRHLALTDVTGMKIQSQEMVAAFSAVLADPSTQARRLAFVVATSLARSQLQRALGSRAAACFTTDREAAQWLLAPENAQMGSRAA